MEFPVSPSLRVPPPLLEALRQPFAPHEVLLRPGDARQTTPEHAWVCQAIPFVPGFVYEVRLDALAPGGWSLTTPSLVVSSDRLVLAAQVQIGPVTHTGYGELLLPTPIAPDTMKMLVRTAPAAFEQAFVEACHRFGLGRYLASLARQWVPYDPEQQVIALSAEAQLAHVLSLYRQAGIALADEEEATAETARTQAPPAAPAASRSIHTRTKRPASEQRQDERARRQRAQDLAWIREQCAPYSKSLPSILRHYQVARLEDLSDAQVALVINSIHTHRPSTPHQKAS